MTHPKRRPRKSLSRLPSIYLRELTEAQRSVTVKLCRGLTLEEIAAQNGRSKSTLRNHLKVIYLRYGITRQHQLVAAVLLSDSVSELKLYGL